ncbi:hypothetical protein OG322_09255 [Streptomyces sp. NBC_01260]|uniref:hypothetical protein n=1 Tax=unclassified Streptomyces TaxID=2593676 RepID=UPI000F551C43|nr:MULTISPECIES: hypothetical protein [unclassified Streptomyces]MCX4769591.1 hypothetical protein [Streptomyces sp. NBC_01285]RPK42698.1 hypothetical protein EES39_20345 [Streptomyces sp. ADI92-24]
MKPFEWPKSISGRLSTDAGQGAIDYAGVVVVVVAVVGGMAATGIGGDLTQRITAQICSLTGGSNCDLTTTDAKGPKSEDKDKAYRPVLCNTKNEQTDSGQEAKIAFVKLGSKFTMKREEFTDESETLPNGDKGTGKRIVITVQEGGEAGLTTGLKAKIAGKKAKVLDLGAGVEVKDGDSWVFSDPEKAAEFQKKVKDLQDSPPKEAGKGFLRVFGVDLDEDERKNFNKEYKDNHITTDETKVKGNAELGLEGESGNNVYGISGAVDASGVKRVARNNWLHPPVISTTRDFEVSAKGKRNWGKNDGPAKRKGEAGIGFNGAITVTRYADGPDKGKLARIDVVKTVTKEGSNATSAEADKQGKGKSKRAAGKGKHRKGAKGTVKGGNKDAYKDVETTTTTLAFPPESQMTDEQRRNREMTEEAIGRGNNDIVGKSEGKPNTDGRSLTNMMTESIPENSPDEAGTPPEKSIDPYARLLHDNAISSRTTHQLKANSKESGFELKAGVSLGYTAKSDTETGRIKKAEFLGAPGENGTRSFKPIAACS